MIWSLAVARPVFTAVIFLVIAIFGGWGYVHLPVREQPDIEFPVVNVSVVLPGAEPEVIETEVIEPLEEEINTIEGLDTLESTSRPEVGTIVAEFDLWKDVDIAAQEVRARVDRASRDLPDGVEAPIVRKLDPDARAILWITLVGDESWDPVRVTRYADERLRERLESIRGVGQIQLGGARRYAVRVRIDPEQLAARDLTVDEVVRTIQRNNVDLPTGRVESESREFLVEVDGQLSAPDPIGRLVVRSEEGTPVRIEDVADVVAGVENDRQVARFAGDPAVGLGVVKQSGANTVALADAVRAKMRSIELPPGLRYEIATDDSTYIEESIRDLLLTIGIATLLVVAVVLGFLHTGWGTLITSIAIPSSLLGGFASMYVFGFSLNTLTMLALILTIGIVVDDAVVVLESCYRQIEQGVAPKAAARVGTTEVAFAAIANSFSLASVFIPVAFTSGLVGRFFREFGITVAVTVFFSTFTALTLTPMLCSRFLRPEGTGSGRIGRALDRGIDATRTAYMGLLSRALHRKLVTALVALALFALAGLSARALPTEFLPTVDRSEMLISFQTPEGATLSETDAYARKIEAVLAEIPEVAHQFLAIGLSQAGPGQVDEGIAFVHLVPRGERALHQTEVMERVRERLQEIPDGLAFVLPGGGGPTQGEAPLQLVLQGEDLDRLSEAKAGLMGFMRASEETVGVDADVKLNRPTLRVSIDRERAADLGVSVEDLSNVLRYFLGEPDISEIERGTERYEIIPEAKDAGQMVPSRVGDFHVRAKSGDLVPLSNIVTMEETLGPSEIHHYARRRSITVSASTPDDVALGSALSSLEAWIAENLPEDVDYATAGRAKDFRESFSSLAMAMIFALVFVYLVLAAQFESFGQPLLVLVSVPLALVGAFGALWLLDMRFSIYTFIGAIMLLGMATKNAILLVDYANVAVLRGRSARAAAEEAARVRFRPVVMTTLSTVLGLLPIALGYGAGGEARAPLGVAVGAGLLATTVLTLVVLPVLYVTTSEVGRWLSARLETRRGRP